MTILDKKFFLNFLLSNLDDVELVAPKNQELPVYDSTSSKWKNSDSSGFLTLNKREYTADVVIPTETRAIMVAPCFSGNIEIEANAILEIAG